MPPTVTGEHIRDIASGVTLTLLIFAAALYVPIIGFFSTLFLPLPVFFYRCKLGRQLGAFVPAIGGVLIVVVLGGEIGLDTLYFAELLLLGFALGELIEINLSIDRTIVIASSTVLLTGFVALIFYGNIVHTGIWTLINAYVSKNLELTMLLYEGMGMSPDKIRMISSSLEEIRVILVRIVPALTIVSVVFVTWSNLLMIRPLLRKKSIFYPNFGPLKLWKAPDILVWCAIGCGLGVLLPVTAIKILSLNALLVLMVLYFFQGIAIVAFFFEKKRFPRGLRIFLYSLIALQQIILLVIIGMGFFDIWLNLRRSGLAKNG